MGILSKKIDRQIAAYQRELIETHYQEVENMYRQIRGWTATSAATARTARLPQSS